MSTRGRKFLELCKLPSSSAERDAAWAALCERYTERSMLAMARDFIGQSRLKRPFLTSEDYRIAQLTSIGEVRLKSYGPHDG